MNQHFKVDVRHTQCPGLYGLLGAVRLAEAGDDIELLTTAPADLVELPEWVTKAKYELLAQNGTGGEWKLVVRRTH